MFSQSGLVYNKKNTVSSYDFLFSWFRYSYKSHRYVQMYVIHTLPIATHMKQSFV